MNAIATPYRIIVADSDEVIRRDIARFMTGLGYEVVTVRTAGDLLSAMHEASCATAVVDCYLSEGGGLNIIDTLLKTNAGTAIVMMMSDPSVDTVISAFRKGATDFLIKPFEAEEMKQVIEHSVEKHRVNEAYAELLINIEKTRLVNDSVEMIAGDK